MREAPRLQVQLVAEFKLSSLAVTELAARIDAFASALGQALEAEGLGHLLSQSRSEAHAFIARIEPPTSIGRALELAGALLKKHRLKREAKLDFEKL